MSHGPLCNKLSDLRSNPFSLVATEPLEEKKQRVD